eukprot:6338802-Prymnesium_polylepis.1
MQRHTPSIHIESKERSASGRLSLQGSPLNQQSFLEIYGFNFLTYCIWIICVDHPSCGEERRLRPEYCACGCCGGSASLARDAVRPRRPRPCSAA